MIIRDFLKEWPCKIQTYEYFLIFQIGGKVQASFINYCIFTRKNVFTDRPRWRMWRLSVWSRCTRSDTPCPEAARSRLSGSSKGWHCICRRSRTRPPPRGQEWSAMKRSLPEHTGKSVGTLKRKMWMSGAKFCKGKGDLVSFLVCLFSFGCCC